MTREQITNRKGARKIEEVPAEVLGLLNRGEIETVNLTEWLAIDHIQLIQHVFPRLGISEQIVEFLAEKVAVQKKPTAMTNTKLIGSSLFVTYNQAYEYPEIVEKLSTHPSDAIRCYAPYLIALDFTRSLEEKLVASAKLVADSHFGVREVVWFALRPEIDKELPTAISFLSQWADSDNENIRRFTTEATRPRGVWCKHIEALKEQPELALPILEKLRSDPSKYVQDSVGNWLNDASKSQPDFVHELCMKWQAESPSKATQKIIKRARRTLDKQK